MAMEELTCLRRSMFTCLEPVLVHDPIALPSVWSSSFVEHKCLPHPYDFGVRKHRLVSPRRLPKPGSGGPIGSSTARVLSVFVAKEVPLTLLLISRFAPIYMFIP